MNTLQRPPSLTLRLTLLFGIAAAVVFAGFGWIIERSIESHFRTEDIAELEAITQSVSQTLSNRGAIDVPTVLEQRFSDILVGHHSAILYVTDQTGRTLYTSPGDHELSAIDHSTFGKKGGVALRSWGQGGHTYRVLTRTLGGAQPGNDKPDSNNPGNDTNRNQSHGNPLSLSNHYMLSVAVAIDGHQRFLDNFRRTLWLMIASGIAVMGLMGWVAVRQGHAPLHQIVAQIRRITASDLNTRLSPDTMPRELSDLADSFNDMLERMEQAFQQLTHFSDDIAHELRTPVTSMLTQTQVALSQSRNGNEYREILYSNIEEYERMAQMISDMLLLAKTENGLYELNSVDIDLNKELQELIEYYEMWAEERDISLTLEGQATVQGDRPMLRRVLGNLLSNAIRHTPPGHTVHAKIKQMAPSSAKHPTRESVIISIENPGSMIPAEHIPKLFDRFYRADASRKRGSEGAGLGLAIAKSIIDVHGGNIEVSSTPECTRFNITLPLSVAL
ncbi:MAG: heavy metal sensor histidine kinase [Ectothiorhodospiraceae bacterium]|nr:heavy metal sensor histidine kinase [Ectothiorhodospiraceae bacterium]